MQGPVTDQVEAEWLRRWRKLVAIADAKVPTKRLFNHLSGAGITDEVVRPNAAHVEEKWTPQTEYPPREDGNFGGVTAQVRLTRSQGVTRKFVTQIRDRLLEKITTANRRIYMENNQFTDPDIVRAIYERRRAVPELQVVIITNPNHRGVGFLTRRAWLHMALRDPSCRSIKYWNRDVLATLNSKDVSLMRGHSALNWEVKDNYSPDFPTSHQWLQTDPSSRSLMTA